MSDNIDIVEVDLDDTNEDGGEERINDDKNYTDSKKVKKPRKPMSEEHKAKLRIALAKAREVSLKNRQLAKKEKLLDRESQMLKRGDYGFGTYRSKSDEEDEDEDRPLKIDRKSKGRPKRAKSPPLVSGRRLDRYYSDEESDQSESDYSSEEEERYRKSKSKAKVKPKKEPKPKKKKDPTLHDQRIDFIERKLNEVLVHVQKKATPIKKSVKNTIVMPAQPQIIEKPITKKVSDDIIKKTNNLLNLFG